MQISRLKNIARPWQRLIPIQSLRQLLGYVAVSLIGSWVALTTIYGFDLPEKTPILFACGFAGASWVLWHNLPGRFCVFADSALQAADAAQRLEAIGWQCGFREVTGTDGQRVMAVAWPRWLTWDENRVHVTLDRHTVCFTAPMGIAWYARSRLNKDMSHVLSPN